MMEDFVVIGAGPVGSRAAARLATLGHRVLVLDRAAEPGRKRSCTGLISMECVRAFDVPDDVILRTVGSATLYSPSGHAVRVERDEPQAAVLDRPAFDTLLVERALAAGAAVLGNSRVTDVTAGRESAVVSYESPDGPQTVEARAVVLACGCHPNLIRKLGFGAYRDSAVGVQAEVASGVDEVEVYFGPAAPKFFSWLVPAAPGRVKVGLLSRGDAGDLLKSWLAALMDAGRITPEAVTLHYGRVPLRPLRKTVRDHLVVVGDAAGQVKPITGGGIYFGLLAADLAAEALHRAAAKNDFSAASLASYERAWQQKLARELGWGYLGRRLLEFLGNRGLDSAFRWAARSGALQRLAGEDDVAFDWHARALGRLVRARLASPFRRTPRA